MRTALGVTTSTLVRQLLTESVMLALAGGLLALPLAYAAVRFIVESAPSGPSAAGERDSRRPRHRRRARSRDRRRASSSDCCRRCSRASARVQRTSRRRATHRDRRHLASSLAARRRQHDDGGGARRRDRAWSRGACWACWPSTSASRPIACSTAASRSPDGNSALTTPSSNIAATVQFYDEFLGRIRRFPASKPPPAVTTLPLGGLIDGYGLHVVGRPLANPESAPSADRFVVTPGYFDTIGIRLQRGRLLDESDRQDAPRHRWSSTPRSPATSFPAKTRSAARSSSAAPTRRTRLAPSSASSTTSDTSDSTRRRTIRCTCRRRSGRGRRRS